MNSISCTVWSAVGTNLKSVSPFGVTGTFFRVVGLNLQGKRYQFNNGGSPWATMMARRKAREATLNFLDQFKRGQLAGDKFMIDQ